MKKTFFPVASFLLALFAAGCTSVDATRKFNMVNVNPGGSQPVCQIHVKMTGFYFFGLPVVVGSAAGDGKCAFFMNNLNNTNAISLLTKEARRHGAGGVTGLSTGSSESYLILPFLSMRQMEASGVAVQGGSRGRSYEQALQ